MFIWNELRLHSLLFAWRACFSILFIDYCFYISFLTIFLADIVTYYYGTPGVSTVRGDQTRVGKRNIFKEIIGAFFSISQIGATIITMGFFQKTPSLILIFSTLPPIQTSAFGMTLIRKNLINKDLWSYFYTAELLITYYIWYLEYKNINIFFISCAIYFIRRYYNISKYTVWLILFFQNFINRIEYKNI
jgi:hypothetical protein